MKLAVMQPYLFPYIGYFQLIHAADKFVVYDDVSFIKQGWINRNRILANGEPLLFTVPLSGASSFRKISETKINVSQYGSWRTKFFKSLEQSYRHAPQYQAVMAMIAAVLEGTPEYISTLAYRSIMTVSSFLRITTEVSPTSAGYGNSDLRGQTRILDICSKEGAGTYINSFGGIALYDFDEFKKAGVTLKFITPIHHEYRQAGKTFVPWLSIIDVLMFNSVEETRLLLDQYELVGQQ